MLTILYNTTSEQLFNDWCKHIRKIILIKIENDRGPWMNCNNFEFEFITSILQTYL